MPKRSVCFSKLFIELLLAISIALSVFSFPYAAVALDIAYAPLSEEFLANRGDESRGGGSPDAVYGVSHLDLSHLSKKDYSSFLSSSSGTLPRKYDLRTYGWTTPAKNQLYNNCWAYSACASLESTFLKQKGVVLDLSETHLSWFSANGTPAFTKTFYSGGYDNIAVAMLARWSGAVLEANLPEGTTPSGTSDSYKNRLHLENAFFLGLQFMDSFERPAQEVMKRLVHEYGGISVGICMATEGGTARFYNEATGAWYYNGTRTRPDHAVLLVGWDDDYPLDSFRADNRPKAGGAWLVKNHWGQDFGDRGFFWVSYEDVSFGDGTAFIAAETSNFDKNYGYDELGWCNSFGKTGSDTIWLSNVFTSSSSAEKLEAVSFYTTANDSEYEITVYTDLSDTSTPSSGKAAASQRGTRDFAGYHTVRLSSPVVLPAGSTFAVAVKMRTPGYDFPGAVESAVAGYSDQAVAKTGESFISGDGSAWLDAKTEMDANVCIRAFTKFEKSIEPDPPIPDNGGSGGCSTGLPAATLILLAGYAVVRRRK